MRVRDVLKGVLIAGAAVGAGKEIAFAAFSSYSTLDSIYSDGFSLSYGNVDTAWADIDADGDLDLMTTSELSDDIIARVYRNNAGTMNLIQTITVYNGSSSGSICGSQSVLLFGDIDNDDIMEVVVSSHFRIDYDSSYSVTKVYTYNGSTLSEVSGSGLPNGTGAGDLGDIDGDGDLDICLLIEDSGSLKFRVLKNNGSGVFSTSQTLESLTMSAYTGTDTDLRGGIVKFGDVDNDGDLDMLVSCWSETSGLLKLYKNDGKGTFAVATSTGLPSTLIYGNAAFGDADGDGDIDLALMGHSGASLGRIYINNGAGNFSSYNSFPGSFTQGSIDMGDADNDGDLDILISGTTGYNNLTLSSKLYNNDGNANFTDSGTSITAAGGSGVAFADFDGDGKLDFVMGGKTAAPQTGTCIVYRNTGATGNTPPVSPSISSPSVGEVVTTTPGNGMLLSWGYGMDSQTIFNGLSYEVSIGTNNGESEVAPSITPVINGSYGLGFVTGGSRTKLFRPNKDGTYYFRVRTVDNGFQRSSWGADRSFTLLYKPDNLTISNKGPQVFLYWTDNSYCEESYRVYRSKQGGTYENVMDLGKDVTSHIDTVSEPALYSYKVALYDAQSGSEAYSDESQLDVSFEKPVLTTVTLSKINKLVNMWWEEITDADGYYVERSTDGVSWSQIYTNTPATSTNRQDTLPEAKVWYYRIGAIYGNYISYGSVIVADLNGETLQDSINNLSSTAYSDSVYLSWEDRSINEWGYTVERSPDGTSYYPIDVLDEDSTYYWDRDVLGHKWYWYRVSMVASNQVGIVTNTWVEMAGSVTNYYTNVFTNLQSIAVSVVVSNFTGNQKMQVTDMVFDGKGDGDVEANFEVSDSDGDLIIYAELYYSTDGVNWNKGTIIGGEGFTSKQRYSVLWKSKGDLLYNGKVSVKIKIFDGYEWNESGEYELILNNGASDNIDTAVIPEIAGGSDSYVIYDLVDGSVISLYDLKGRLVRQLDVGPDGKIEWDLNDNSGTAVRIGYYLMVIDAQGQRRKKVIFVSTSR